MQQKKTIDYSINYTTIDSYCNSKSAVVLSLNITHNRFGDILNFCRNFLFPLSHGVLNMETFKISYAAQRQTDLSLNFFCKTAYI